VAVFKPDEIEYTAINDWNAGSYAQKWETKVYGSIPTGYRSKLNM
jgi:hypothetical protein